MHTLNVLITGGHTSEDSVVQHIKCRCITERPDPNCGRGISVLLAAFCFLLEVLKCLDPKMHRGADVEDRNMIRSLQPELTVD